MYICIYVYMYLCIDVYIIYVYMNTCIFVYMYFCIFIYICMYFCIYVYLYICIFAYLNICVFVYMYICIYVYVYICLLVYMYIRIYVYMYLKKCVDVYALYIADFTATVHITLGNLVTLGLHLLNFCLLHPSYPSVATLLRGNSSKAHRAAQIRCRWMWQMWPVIRSWDESKKSDPKILVFFSQVYQVWHS